MGGVESSISDKLLSSKQAFQFFWHVFLYDESASQKLREAEDNIHKNAQDESDLGTVEQQKRLLNVTKKVHLG